MLPEKLSIMESTVEEIAVDGKQSQLKSGNEAKEKKKELA